MQEISLEKYFFGSDTEKLHNKKLILVIYDITDNKRRYKFVKFIERYGRRVQKSAFELILENRIYAKLLKEIPPHIDSEDNVRIYRLPLNGEVTAWGSMINTEEDVIII
ncbi:MAG: CRISPR-associated endonuclease Cas2 [Ruminococcus sp.]|nr:CRISPR-associated endonuclease Cas2 [Ruminococcus sp.]